MNTLHKMLWSVLLAVVSGTAAAEWVAIGGDENITSYADELCSKVVYDLK